MGISPRPTGSLATYISVYTAMLALWGLNMGLSYVYLGPHWNNAIAVAIGLTTVLLAALFFMHLYGNDPSLVRLFAVTAVLCLGILLVLTMSDHMTRAMPSGANPKGEPVFLPPKQINQPPK